MCANIFYFIIFLLLGFHYICVSIKSACANVMQELRPTELTLLRNSFVSFHALIGAAASGATVARN